MRKNRVIKGIENNESFLIADDEQFLGILTLNKYASESISNPYGDYGSKYSSKSIFNKYGNYGSKYSSLSPFNKYTSTPPIIYLRGSKYGFLSKNKYKVGTIIDPDNLFDWMKEMRLEY